jgi:hypothetical protein
MEKIQCNIDKSLPLVPLLSQMNPVHTHTLFIILPI